MVEASRGERGDRGVHCGEVEHDLFPVVMFDRVVKRSADDPQVLQNVGEPVHFCNTVGDGAGAAAAAGGAPDGELVAPGQSAEP